MARRRDNRWHGKGRWACAALLGMIGQGSFAAVPCSYSLEVVQHECGWPFPDSVTEGTGISSTGVACGWYRDCVQLESHAFTWAPGGGIQTIPYPPGIDTMEAYDVNDADWVVGRMAGPAINSYRGFLHKDAQVMDLGVLPGGNWSEAFAIASDGTIVGWSGLTPQVAVVWRDGVMTSLAPLLSTASSKAQGVSEDGRLITGWAGPSISSAQAFVLDGKRVTFLPLPPGAVSSQGLAVSSQGNVCGRFTTTSVHAYADLNGKSITLLELPGAGGSLAIDLNDEFIVGYSGSTTGVRGVVWTYDGQVYDLNNLIPRDANVTIQEAHAVSESGQITGTAIEPVQGGAIAVRLTPVWPPSGDLNCDQIVNGFDLALLLGYWGYCRTTTCPADLSKDGVVNGIDLAVLLSLWG